MPSPLSSFIHWITTGWDSSRCIKKRSVGREQEKGRSARCVCSFTLRDSDFQQLVSFARRIDVVCETKRGERKIMWLPSVSLTGRRVKRKGRGGPGAPSSETDTSREEKRRERNGENERKREVREKSLFVSLSSLLSLLSILSPVTAWTITWFWCTSLVFLLTIHLPSLLSLHSHCLLRTSLFFHCVFPIPSGFSALPHHGNRVTLLHSLLRRFFMIISIKSLEFSFLFLPITIQLQERTGKGSK